MELFEVAEDTFVLLPASWLSGKARQFMKGLEFTHVIVQRTEEPQAYYYLYTKTEALNLLAHAGDQQLILDAFNLHEYTATAALDAHTNADKAPDRTVVLDEGRVVGFFDVEDLTENGLTRRPQPTLAVKRFEAYPTLEAPEQVLPEAEFEVIVGFRDDLDPHLIQSGQMTFYEIQPGDQCLVVLIPDGVEVNQYHGYLSLQMDAQVRFTCRAKPNVGEATVAAQYFYKNQMIGMARRIISIVKGNTRSIQSPIDNPCRLAVPDPSSYVDLTITITHSKDGLLQWIFSAPNPQIATEQPITTSLQDARDFAADLIRELKTQNHTGRLAANILEKKGQDIADNMPLEFFDILQQVHAAIGQTPTVLLLTDETYVPWELALLDKPFDQNAPPFLAAQTHMGRWLLHEKVTFPPAVTVDVVRFTAVAAKYGLAAGLRELKEAIAEQATLQQRWNAIPLKATKADLEAVVTGAKVPGHLIHFAVHGLSNPQANEQALLLADKTQLVPSALTGRYKCGDVPRFAFVFLNACQVGAAGTSLGQAAGFPGDLIRGGVLGFIAPLWEVHDERARVFAETFYTETLAQEQTVGAVLYTQRNKYSYQDSTTPIAYIYYGHPTLRLRHALA